TEALFGASGKDGRKARKRLASAARCGFYAFVASSVLAFAVDRDNGSGSSDRQSRDVTARALALPAGPWLLAPRCAGVAGRGGRGLVALGGAGVAGAGVWIGVRAARRKYHKELRPGELSRRTRALVDVTGVGGGIARGLVFAAAGAFAVRAAVDYEPDRAKGLDDTLRSFAQTPAGPWLLAGVAAGLVLFGMFSFALARWRRV